jgi:hypothetical protein
MGSEKNKNTKMGLHIASQLTKKSSKELSSSLKKYKSDFPFQEEDLDKLKISLSETEYLVLEHILNLFTETNYKGNVNPVPINDLLKNGTLSPNEVQHFDTLSHLPRLQLSKEDIYKFATGNSIGARERVLDSFLNIGKKMFTFAYERAFIDDTNRPARDIQGKLKKELISYSDTLFKIANVSRDGKRGVFEIIPSFIFLDQLDKYFILFPVDWRDEIKQITGKKRIPNTLLRLIFCLRIQYEIKRRKNDNLSLNWSVEKACSSLDVPANYVKSHKSYLKNLFKQTYEYAVMCGYLESFSINEDKHQLNLNPSKYYDPKLNSISSCKADVDSLDILKSFYKKLKEIGLKQDFLKGNALEKGKKYISYIIEKGYSKEDILSVIIFGLKDPFWCTQINTPKKLKQSFEDVFIQQKSKCKGSLESNIQLAKKVVSELEPLSSEHNFKLELDSDILWIGSKSFSIKDKKFEKEIEMYLEKVGKTI